MKKSLLMGALKGACDGGLASIAAITVNDIALTNQDMELPNFSYAPLYGFLVGAVVGAILYNSPSRKIVQRYEERDKI